MTTTAVTERGEEQVLEALVALASASSPVEIEQYRSEAAELLGSSYGRYEELLDALATRSMQLHRLERLATQDALTGLANRRAFGEALNRELARRRRLRGPAVILLDLDCLKDINDEFGHGAGDDAIRATAMRCAETVRADDLAARLGGDEFAILLPDTDLAGARVVADRLRDAIEQERVCGARLRVSLGIAVAGPDGDDEARVLGAADRRLYDDKRNRKSNVSVLVAAA